MRFHFVLFWKSVPEVLIVGDVRWLLALWSRDKFIGTFYGKERLMFPAFVVCQRRDYTDQAENFHNPSVNRGEGWLEWRLNKSETNPPSLELRKKS